MMSLATPRMRGKLSAISSRWRRHGARISTTVAGRPTVGRPTPPRPSASSLLRLEWSSGPPAPIFPGAVDAVRPGAGENLVYLAGGQEFDLAHVHGLLLQPCIDLEVNR